MLPRSNGGLDGGTEECNLQKIVTTKTVKMKYRSRTSSWISIDRNLFNTWFGGTKHIVFQRQEVDRLRRSLRVMCHSGRMAFRDDRVVGTGRHQSVCLPEKERMKGSNDYDG
ncbi:uncharacterized protein LOC112127545 [Cimex lectularius]|uniref:Uncharacterized protein n=1 Tax=Cimex lectularius TaxID=79782 RepID=A0A8I6SMG4_CIMLE|nr:uncharacterized protein LOC112127545 [Cimex lectularius]